MPGNTAELEPLWRAGVFGFKCFLVPSGVDEFCHVGEEDLREAMPVLARLGEPLLVHAECPSYLPARQPESECDAIAMIIRLSRETGARVQLKAGPYETAWGGIASLETGVVRHG